jgi:hypothetical protein
LIYRKQSLLITGKVVKQTYIQTGFSEARIGSFSSINTIISTNFERLTVKEGRRSILGSDSLCGTS